MAITLKAAAIALALQAAAPRGLEGQHDVRWWEAALVLGAIGGATLLDRGTDSWMQNQRSATSNSIARAFRHAGQPEVYLTVGGGLFAAGVVSGKPNLRRSGGRVVGSVLAAGLTSLAIKEMGRVRPAETSDAFVFRPLSRHESFPSGHTTMAFALATSLSAEIDRDWATALLYAGAAGTGWSRMNDRRHWLSDVMAGAAVGITVANVMEGRWRVFGLGPPKFLVDPSGDARVEWRMTF